MTQTKRDTLVLQVGGVGRGGADPTLKKKPMFRKPQRCLGMEASYEGGQGPEGAVAPWMDG